MIAEAIRSLRNSLPQGVQLVAVSKFHPVQRLMEAYDAGQRLFGENRPQELAAKAPQMPSDVQWHFIGHLQTNKLKLVLPYVCMVQSVDSFHLLEAIGRWCQEHETPMDILLELHLGAEETKSGFTEDEILHIIQSVSEPSWRSSERPAVPGTFAEAKVVEGEKASGDNRGQSPLECCRGRRQVSEATPSSHNYLRFRGLMGMATNTEDMAVVEADFARIEALFLRIKKEHPELEAFDQLSIGMSGDWSLAIKHGATMVRIGTDIFGPREY